MDFSALLQAASENSSKLKEKQGTVLVTKLSAPKKEERKVDVAAIKRRLEEQKQKAEKTNKVANGQKASQVKKPTVTNNKTITKTTKPTESKKEPLKYENKQHEEKHKQFMGKINKLGKIAQSKSDPQKTKVNIKPAAAMSKPKTQVAPPSFKDILAMAEKGVKDPSVLSQGVSKSSSPKPEIPSQKTNNISSSKASAGNSNVQSKPQKCDLKDSVSKPSKDLKVSKRPQTSEKQVPPISNKHKKCDDEMRSKSNTPVPSTVKSTQGKPTSSSNAPSPLTAGSKRSASPSLNKTPQPQNMKPGLSASAMAKLAYREGRNGSAIPPAPPSRNDKHKLSPGNPVSVTSKSKVSSMGSNSSSAVSDAPPAKKAALDASSPGVSAWDRLMGNGTKDKSKKKPAQRGRYIDSEEEEEDDDLDDFIDDGEDEIDYSAAIRDIFGYDKSRYKDEDFDDRSMVARYADIMKEEVRSAKIGKEEDLRDMMLEEEEKRRKKQMKKAKNSR